MITLNQPEEMLFALLRSALGTQPIDPQRFGDATAEAWQACFKLAVKQGVTALALDGVLQLPADAQPPKALKLSWAMTVEKHEARYRRYCQTAEQLFQLYAAHGIATVQMKGVGFSTYYPTPQHREGGDIDIYTYSADPARMSDKEANTLADELMVKQGNPVDYHSPKHSNFCFRGVPVENHKTFLNVEQYDVAVECDALLHQLLQPEEALLCGEYRIRIPSPAFNTLFLAFHAAQHYGCGLALHHLCDWVCLLQRCGLQIPDGVNTPVIRHWMVMLTKLCNDHLGTDIPLPEACDEVLADEVMSEMLHPYLGEEPPRGKWGILCFKTRRLFYLHRLRSKVLQQSMTQRLWQSVVFHLRHPETVFKTER